MTLKAINGDEEDEEVDDDSNEDPKEETGDGSAYPSVMEL